MPRLSRKRAAALLHDLLMTAIAIVVCYVVRFGPAAFSQRLDEMALLAVLVLPVAAVVYQLFGLYSAVWRFASVPDLMSILKAVTALAGLMAVLDFATRGGVMVPRSIAVLFWFVAAALLAGPRLAFRSYRDLHLRAYGQTAPSLRVPALVLGDAHDAEVLIRSLETDPEARLRPVGILSFKPGRIGQKLRGVPVLGTETGVPAVAASLQARNPAPLRLVVTDEALRDPERCERAIADARSLGMPVDRVSPYGGSGDEAVRTRLTDIDIADLRTREDVDAMPLRGLVAGRVAAVTGGGGILGTEICRQVAAAGCSRLLVVENAELALYECQRMLAAEFPELEVAARLQDVRNAGEMEELFLEFRPAIVFHAAAMKHEGTVSQQIGAGLSVNLAGTIAVANAAIAAGTGALVHFSNMRAAHLETAVGATQRLAELYLRLVGADTRSGRPGVSTRILSVRFGHVYSARGATLALMRDQIARGGPVRIDKDLEPGLVLGLGDAVAHVLRSTALALGREETGLLTVDLGTPVELADMARRMVRLAGLEPDDDVAIEVREPAYRTPDAADLRTRVATLSARAERDPHVVMRELLALARTDGAPEGALQRIAPLEYVAPPARGASPRGNLH